MIQYDERWNQDWPLVIFHDQVVALKFPDLICIGLYAVVGVTGDGDLNNRFEDKITQIVRLFSLVNWFVCVRVRKHGCHVTLSASPRGSVCIA